MVVPRWFTPAFMAREPAAVQTVTDMLTADHPEGYAGCGEAIAALDLRPLLASVQAPTLVLSGAEDVAAPPSIGAATARAIPGARLTVIQGASHFAHYERPGPVTDALLAHFTSTPLLCGRAGDRVLISTSKRFTGPAAAPDPECDMSGSGVVVLIIVAVVVIGLDLLRPRSSQPGAAHPAAPQHQLQPGGARTGSRRPPPPTSRR